jgi:hypothetical protein
MLKSLIIMREFKLLSFSKKTPRNEDSFQYNSFYDEYKKRKDVEDYFCIRNSEWISNMFLLHGFPSFLCINQPKQDDGFPPMFKKI